MATSVWRGYISFGLVTIPVRLYKAARIERVKLREVYKVPAEAIPMPDVTGVRPEPAEDPAEEMEEPVAVTPVRRVAVSGSDDQILPAQAVTKGYEFDKGRFVTLDPNELKSLAPKTSTEMELMEFVDLSSVDPIYFETSYYVQPERAGEKPYALLYASLKHTGLVGMARIAMHRREHIVIIRSGRKGLIAHTMYFNSQVRTDQEYTADTALVNPKELELADTLVKSLAAEFTPEKYRDSYREQLEKMIAAKVAGEAAAGPAHIPLPAKAPVDILEALRKSLARIKKPAESERPAREPGDASRSKTRGH
jgi:DNA end-binding protein Ku